MEDEILLAKKTITSIFTPSSSTSTSKKSEDEDNGNQNNVASDLPSTNKSKKPMNKTLKISLIVGAFLVPIVAGIIYYKRKTK